MAINSIDDHQNIPIGALDTKVPLNQSESEPVTDLIATSPMYMCEKKNCREKISDCRCKIHKANWVKEKTK